MKSQLKQKLAELTRQWIALNPLPVPAESIEFFVVLMSRLFLRQQTFLIAPYPSKLSVGAKEAQKPSL